MTKLLGILLLLGAGATLLVIGARAGGQDYVPAVPASKAVPIELSGPVPAGFVVRELDVEGMCCVGCSAKLHRALINVDGVREAAVDHVLGTAAVVAPTELDVEFIADALRFGKYSAWPHR